MPPLILLDTNVFISSRFGHASRAIVSAWEEGRLVIGLSTPIFREYEHILGTVPFLRGGTWERWRQRFQDADKCIWIEPTEKLTLSEDPADNKFLEAASALGARAIVSSDHHLLDLAEEFFIPIVKPGDFLLRFPEIFAQ